MDRPDFLKVGAIVKVQHWYGEVVDIATTEAGRVMVLVISPKGIWRNHPAEWLEYQEGQITQDDLAKALENIDLHRRLIEKMLTALDDMEGRWTDRLAGY